MKVFALQMGSDRSIIPTRDIDLSTWRTPPVDETMTRATNDMRGSRPTIRRRGMMSRSLYLCLAVAVAAPVTVLGQEQSGAAAAAPIHPLMDIGDMWRAVRYQNDAPERVEPPASKPRSHFVVVAPTIGSKPSTGLTGGVNSNVAFFRGDPATTHISSLSGGFRVSQKKQVLSGFRFSIFTEDDRWFLQGDHRLSWTSQNTHALGTDTVQVGAENLKFQAVKVYDTAYRRVRPGLFVGLGLNVSVHSDIRRSGHDLPPTWEESAYVAYSKAHGFSPEDQRSSGASVGLLFDTRDNAINAQHGWLASTTYRTFFNGFLGGASTWQELSIDVRRYRAFTDSGRQKLALWFMGDFVTGGTAPYFNLPATGSDGRSARGYGDGRYRGPRLVYGEIEYRGMLTRNGLLGFVSFVNTTTVGDPATGKNLFDTYALGAGLGLRVLLNKHSRTNLCADYGWGKAGSRGLYLGIQEAF